MSKATGPMVHYTVILAPDRHELQVEARFTGAFAAADTLLLQTPTWVPGDYNFTQYARDIFDISAVDNVTGDALPVRRAGWQGFRVHAPKGDVTVRYRAYAFDPEFGEPSGILDDTFAVLLGTRYLHSAGHLGVCRVSYQLPESWKGTIHHPSGATALGDDTWEYPSYEILLDTPVVMGAFDLYERKIGDTPIYFAFVDRGVGFEREVAGFIDDVIAVAKFFREMYDGYPFDDYTFVLSLNPQNYWGLEHLTSTMCGLGPDVFTDEDQYRIGVRVCAHEMFHAWNVRRLRPAPLNQLQHQLDTGSFTEGLWVAEGFTRYYEFLSCTVTGVYTPEEFFSNVVGYYEHLTAVPAYERISAVDSSLATYLNHNPKYPGRVDSCIDYYDKGMLIAFGLDASLRLDTPDWTLNRAFSAFYSKFVHWPIGQSPDPGYTTDDVIGFFDGILPGLGDRLDREANHPGGLNTESLLRRLGFEVARGAIYSLGLVFTDDTWTIYNVLDDSAAAATGLAAQDVITHVNGFQVTHAGLKWAATHGDPVTLGVLRGHRALSFTITPGQRTVISKLVWRGDETQQQRLFAWFGRTFPLADGQEIPLSFYENFHGIETAL